MVKNTQFRTAYDFFVFMLQTSNVAARSETRMKHRWNTEQLEWEFKSSAEYHNAAVENG